MSEKKLQELKPRRIPMDMYDPIFLKRLSAKPTMFSCPAWSCGG